MPAIGNGNGVGFGGQKVYQASSKNYFARMSTPLSSYRKNVVDDFFKGMTYLSKIEVLQLYFMPTDAQALMNAMSTSYTATLSSTPPTRFPFSGYKGNQSSMYVNTGFDASASSVFLQDDCHIGRFAVELGAQGAYSDFGSSSNSGARNIGLLSRYQAAKEIAQLNVASYTTADDVATTPVVGAVTLSRKLAASSRFSQNQEAEKTNTKTSVARPSGNIFVLATNIAGTAGQHTSAKIGAFWAGAGLTEAERLDLNARIQTLYDKIFENVKFTGNVCCIGDSTIALYLTVNSPIAYFLRATGTITDIAHAGDTIAQQKTLYDALSSGTKSGFNYVFVQVGLNDLDPAESAATALARYQGLIDDINTNSPSAKVVCGTMNPCKQRLIDVYGAVNGPIAYQKWLDMNTAITGSGPNAITGVDQVVTRHTTQLNDGSGNLASAYDLGDHIHENNDGRGIVASSWNTAK